MSKPNSGPTWALLSPNKLPSGSETKKILGAIVPDYENPVQNAIPEDTSTLFPKDWFTEPTEDGNFKAALDRAKGDKAFIRLGKILGVAFEKSIHNNYHLISTKVMTFAVRKEVQAFKLLKEGYKTEIESLIGQSPRRRKGCVFMIVAIKTCSDAQISAIDHSKKSKKVDIKAPVNEIVVAAGGAKPPLDLDLEIGGESTGIYNKNENLVAKGERIFAVQYRIIKKKSQWITTPKPKLPADFDLKDLFVPDGPSMFGDDRSEEEEELSDEDDEENEDEDAIEIGDIEHTWSLSGSTEDEIVLTTL